MRKPSSLRTINCSRCTKEFETKRRDLLCVYCADRRSNKKCLNCGDLISDVAVRCKPCNKIYLINLNKERVGENNKNWKGGTSKTANGYLYEKRAGHPRAKAPAFYVLQHILVMEKKLGRYLLPGENVHHRNGVRDDNRPENLELWVTYQPSGQRPEDLVEWAQEILRRYVLEI